MIVDIERDDLVLLIESKLQSVRYSPGYRYTAEQVADAILARSADSPPTSSAQSCENCALGAITLGPDSDGLESALQQKKPEKLPYRVPVEPFRQHVEDLEARGFSRMAIATVAKLNKTILSDSLDPDRELIVRKTADKVLAVTPERIFAELPDMKRVPSLGTQRRILALLAHGWRRQDLFPGSRARHILEQQQVSAEMHRRMCAMYEELKDKPGPSSVNRLQAASAGWVGPERWIGLDMDDPWTEPAPKADRLEDVVRVRLDRNDDVEVIASDLGYKVGAIGWKLRNLGHKELARPFDRRSQQQYRDRLKERQLNNN